MKELNFRELLSSLNDIVLVAKAVCKYDIAALVNKLCSCFIALVAFRNVCFLEDLYSGFFTSFFTLFPPPPFSLF